MKINWGGAGGAYPLNIYKKDLIYVLIEPEPPDLPYAYMIGECIYKYIGFGSFAWRMGKFGGRFPYKYMKYANF